MIFYMPNHLMYVFDNLLKYLLFLRHKIKLLKKALNLCENSWYGRYKLKPVTCQCNNDQRMCRCMKSNAKTSGQFSGVYFIFFPHIQCVTEQTSTEKEAICFSFGSQHILPTCICMAVSWKSLMFLV